jgi:peptidyl-prolyl cis-trans isomerase SurA
LKCSANNMNMRFFTKEDILPQVITRIFHLPIFLIFLIIYNTPSQASDTLLVDKVLAIVGDNIVLLSDIELQYAQLSAERLDMPVEFKCEILEQMLTQKLFLQQAKVDSVVVSDDEINNELDRRIRYFIGMIGSVEKLEAYYEKSIVEIKDEFRKDIAEQMLAQKMQTQIFGTIKVTPSEVKSFFNDIPEDSLPYYNAEVEVMQIVKIPEVSPEQKQLAIEKIGRRFCQARHHLFRRPRLCRERWRFRICRKRRIGY